jgi:phosphonate transport system permease protein
MARRPSIVGTRAAVLLAILVVGIFAAGYLSHVGDGPSVNRGGLEVGWRFFSRAFSPAFTSEGTGPTAGTRILPVALEAAWTTVIFAAAALGLSGLFGLFLGFLGSTAWWTGDPAGGAGPIVRFLGRTFGPGIYVVTRTLIAAMRSVHELIWAVLFLAAMGRSDMSAVIAIAIPYAGTFGKVFSEMIDEAPRDAANALRLAGAGHLQVFLFGLLPRALPDMTAYAFYRFECGLRSAAVLGFFGFPTLGYHIGASYENTYYGEVWTYLYTLFVLILVVEAWSGALRRRFVA